MIRTLVIAVLVIFAPARALANMGRPAWGGSRAGEPDGLRDIAIQREELVIDLRPVAADHGAQIAATYHLDNRGAASTVPLVFATGADGVSDFTVTVDGAVDDAASRSGKARPFEGALPATWRAPATTPVPGGGDAAYDLSGLVRGDEHERQARAYELALSIPPGAHTVVIRYQAEPLHHHRGDPTLLHQLAYVLAPARTWASFGGLAVTIEVPPGWEAAVAPAVARTGDTLRGAFRQLPADAIALSIRAPSRWFMPLRVIGVIALVLVGLGGGFVVAAWSRWVSRPDAIYPSLTRAAGLGFVWALGFAVTGILAIVAPAWALPDGQVDAFHGYAAVGYGALVVLVALAIWPIGAVVAWWVDRRLVLAARAAEMAALSVS